MENKIKMTPHEFYLKYWTVNGKPIIDRQLDKTYFDKYLPLFNLTKK